MYAHMQVCIPQGAMWFQLGTVLFESDSIDLRWLWRPRLSNQGEVCVCTFGQHTPRE